MKTIQVISIDNVLIDGANYGDVCEASRNTGQEEAAEILKQTKAALALKDAATKEELSDLETVANGLAAELQRLRELIVGASKNEAADCLKLIAEEARPAHDRKRDELAAQMAALQQQIDALPSA